MTATSQEIIQSSQWHHLSIQEVTRHLDTNLETGLTSAVAAKKRERFGANELKSKPGTSPLLRFLLQFNQPLLYILLIAGAIKAFLGQWVNAGVIWGVTLINAIIGFVQESKAESAIAALASSVKTNATIIRNGQKMQVPSTELVPGDVVLLASGDKVPADLRLVQARNLQVNESALTGESIAIEKNIQLLDIDTPLAERTNMAYAGSFVTFGTGKGIVVAIGDATETGRISQLIEQGTSLKTPLTRKFDKFSRTLLYIILGIAALMFAVGLGYGYSWVEMFEAAIAFAVSAIPEGLPAVVTVTLAIGVSRMARRHAIVRKLPAVETLGSATVICSDKTGTLTENQMTVQAIYAGDQNYTVTGVGYVPQGKILLNEKPVNWDNSSALQECIKAGLLCNDSHLEKKNGQWQVVGDPTEGALIVVANKVGITRSSLEEEMPRLDVIPFESEFQYMATLHETSSFASDKKQGTIYVKGSVEAILKRCQQMLDVEGNLIPLDAETIHQEVDAMAHQGLRVLAFAKKTVPDVETLCTTSLQHADIENDLIFLGLQGMIDPPRKEAIKAVQACQEAGIQVKMITGDHAVTAQAIARSMGFNKNGEVLAFTGSQLAQMGKSELATAIEDGVVFARVAPEQKLRIVEALQSRGEVVAMTGDGVNDAPALKQADIGIAMGGAGTEVAKEASDMILTDDNFASIEAAVEEGRTVYRNLLKAIAFILPVNGGESMTILISVLLARELPILSLQVLWLNMVNSITMTVPLAFEPKSERVMQKPPRNPSEPLLSPSLLQRILAISIFNWILIFGVFEWIQQTTGNINLARTMAIQALVAGRIFYLLSISQLGSAVIASIRGIRHRINDTSAIVIGIACTVILQIIFSQWNLMNSLFSTAPLNLNQWLICLLIGLPMVIVSALVNRFDPLD
ncbi:carbonate dehydratase [Fischerella thermalis WC114]|uniref:ATPase, P-type (Transporting), HAD superfamily, subfamily IC n=1 Tax=Fischerella thermalis JSC-11 TaxID=741277 RepID=G6FTW9_9CYAN|nr:cation-transporting P-type ATPase [Fischerella thermalis]EHC14052.1 ATPase, P-type (transporting), HAD superfamily, subfamily IC [Fischerella thermalis JSC-11]PLZ13628.1 carbonate dehydratase [Fischerella thermalis WC114]PLZ23370.1 carbonate dehydratase [Fischerella thermalis WC157]PLZ34543.1 carbonate dehydratase [Fischerella thermalis WC558]PLZ53193.1 carbonate dehydratase [Fischerella thermalis WC439]